MVLRFTGFSLTRSRPIAAAVALALCGTIEFKVDISTDDPRGKCGGRARAAAVTSAISGIRRQHCWTGATI
jgi:hypothetical protein